MSSSEQNWGITFSVFALTFAIISSFVRRTYSTTLDICQISYIITYKQSQFFSQQLGPSWLTFIPNPFKDSCDGDFNCNHGHLTMIFGLWLGILIMAAIIVCIGRSFCCENASFSTFYRIYRGFFRWFFAPLLFFSIW